MRRIPLVLLCVVLAATACGDDGDAAPAPTTSTTSTASSTTSTTTTEAAPTTTAEATDEELIIAVVERFYEIVVEANNPPMLDNPIWDEVATPDFADGLRSRAAGNLEDREGLRNPSINPEEIIAPNVLEIANDVAFMEFCLLDDTIAYDLDTDAVIDDSVVFVWIQQTLSKTNDGWRVADTTSIERFGSEAPCVASLS
ncbi:MAG: hypothetical protein AAF548_10030 [Actinomycetota bacterium]